MEVNVDLKGKFLSTGNDVSKDLALGKFFNTMSGVKKLHPLPRSQITDSTRKEILHDLHHPIWRDLKLGAELCETEHSGAIL